MVYKLDPENRSEDFSVLAYQLYLKKMFQGKDSIKTVKIRTQEVPAGKTVKELKAMGVLDSTNIESGTVKETAPMATRSARKPTKLKAKRVFWYTSDISSEVADNIDYIKWRRAATKRIIKWLETRGAENYFLGGPLKFKQISDLSDLQEEMNTIEMLHVNKVNATANSLIFRYELNGDYESKSQYESGGFLEFAEDRLSALFYHLSVKWLPEIYSWYVDRCGEIKRFKIEEEEPLIKITFINEIFESAPYFSKMFEDKPGAGAMAFVSYFTERMHFDLTDYYSTNLQPDGTFELPDDRKEIGRQSNDNWDNTVNHELHHFWSKDGFISNSADWLKLPNRFFTEGFAELFSALGHSKGFLSTFKTNLDLDKDAAIAFWDGVFPDRIAQAVRPFLREKINNWIKELENGFSSGNDFSYLGGGCATLFLARKMHKRGYYILDFYNEVNKDDLDEDFDDIFKKYSGYEDEDEWEEDFLNGWKECFHEIAKENQELYSNEVLSIDSRVIGGPGTVTDIIDYIPDEPAIPREDLWGQNVFVNLGSSVGRKSAIPLFKDMADEENQVVYFCEDVTYSNIENFKGILELTDDILEAYCIVVTHSDPGGTTSTNIEVYDGVNNKQFTKVEVGNKNLYVIGVNIGRDTENSSHLVEVLNMIPDTVNKYEELPKEFALGNLLISQTLA